jgi:uncharacterized membrane protein
MHARKITEPNFTSMKLLSFSILFLTIATAVLAQESTAPAKEFALALSQNALELKPGETKDITVMLQKSRSYSKLKADVNLSSSLPAGVKISFDPDSGVLENTKAVVSVSEDAKPGNYTVIINGTMNHKNKGAMLKLIIKGTGDLTGL